MSELVGYNGPILMTAPTKAIVPYMLEDYRRVALETKDIKEIIKDDKKEMTKEQIEKEVKAIIYTPDHIRECAKKVNINVENIIEIKFSL